MTSGVAPKKRAFARLRPRSISLNLSGRSLVSRPRQGSYDGLLAEVFALYREHFIGAYEVYFPLLRPYCGVEFGADGAYAAHTFDVGIEL